MNFTCCKKVFEVSLEHISDSERMQSVTHSNAIVQTRLASLSNMCGVSLERVWLFIWPRSAFHSNSFWLLVRTRLAFCSNMFSINSWTHPGWGANAFILRANVLGQKTCYLVHDWYYIWCSSIDKLDNFELFIDHQHYFSSFKLLHHYLHFAKILFNRQHDYCARANKPRPCSDNRGSI